VGAVFDTAPMEPKAVAIQIGKMYFDAPCKFCLDGGRAMIGIRAVDYIGHPRGDPDVCSAHAKRLIERALAKGLAIELRG
jgi:hypothetical protein